MVIYLWLIFLSLGYVVLAIFVGRICAINTRWEKTVDQIQLSTPPGLPPSFTSAANRLTETLHVPERAVEEEIPVSPV